MTFSFTIAVAPRTKKTHGRIVYIPVKGSSQKRPIMLPSEQFCQWNDAAQRTLIFTRRKLKESINFPVNCAAIFYREKETGDAVGYYQALADTLEAAGIVLNDKFITQWDGSRLLKDNHNPRVEVTLTALGPIQESLLIEEPTP